MNLLAWGWGSGGGVGLPAQYNPLISWAFEGGIYGFSSTYVNCSYSTGHAKVPRMNNRGGLHSVKNNSIPISWKVRDTEKERESLAFFLSMKFTWLRKHHFNLLNYMYAWPFSMFLGVTYQFKYPMIDGRIVRTNQCQI